MYIGYIYLRVSEKKLRFQHNGKFLKLAPKYQKTKRENAIRDFLDYQIPVT